MEPETCATVWVSLLRQRVEYAVWETLLCQRPGNIASTLTSVSAGRKRPSRPGARNFFGDGPNLARSRHASRGQADTIFGQTLRARHGADAALVWRASLAGRSDHTLPVKHSTQSWLPICLGRWRRSAMLCDSSSRWCPLRGSLPKRSSDWPRAEYATATRWQGSSWQT